MLKQTICSHLANSGCIPEPQPSWPSKKEDRSRLRQQMLQLQLAFLIRRSSDSVWIVLQMSKLLTPSLLRLSPATLWKNLAYIHAAILLVSTQSSSTLSSPFTVTVQFSSLLQSVHQIRPFLTSLRNSTLSYLDSFALGLKSFFSTVVQTHGLLLVQVQLCLLHRNQTAANEFAKAHFCMPPKM